MIPAHITGFFTIHLDNSPLKSGSTGAGLTVDKGVEVYIEENGTGKIYYNNERVDICPVKKILNKVDNLFDVYFSSPFPLGSGLGMSGACSLALSKNLNLGLETAHIAEVECKTGLGDVIAQEIGGFVIRLTPGFPASIKRGIIEDDYYIIVEILGKKHTKDILINPDYVQRINYIGEEILDRLLLNPTIKNFIKLSYEFAVRTNLIDDKIKELCKDLSFTVGASQSMIGKTLFCIVKKEHLNDAISILKNPIVCKIYNKGEPWKKID